MTKGKERLALGNFAKTEHLAKLSPEKTKFNVFRREQHKKSNYLRFSLIGVLMIFLLVNFVCAVTGSIGNSKMILYPEVNGWTITTIEKSILVKNVNDEEVKITLETDEEGGKFLELIDESFILQPNTEKKAEFLVKVRKEGKYQGRINVFFSPTESEGPGVVLSSSIIVIAEKDQGYEEIEETEEDNENQSVSIITGGAVGTTNESKNSGIYILGFGSLGLLILLGILIFLLNKKRVTKKGGKLNAKRKK